MLASAAGESPRGFKQLSGHVPLSAGDMSIAYSPRDSPTRHDDAYSPRGSSVSSSKDLDDRVYRTLHALERLSGVVSLLVKRVEKLEAHADATYKPEDVFVSLPDAANSVHREETGELVTKVRMCLTEDPAFKGTVLGIVQEAQLHGDDGDPKNDTTALAPKLNAVVLNELSAERGMECGAAEFAYTRLDYLNAQQTWVAKSQMYEFEESAWDSTMFAFSGILTTWDSMFLIMMYITNLILQFGLVSLVWRPFTHPDMDSQTVIDATQWRTNVAHDVRRMDSITGMSLARLVCSYDMPYMSSSYGLTLSKVLDYIPSADYGQFHYFMSYDTGACVCGLCLVLWWFTCFVELRHTVDCFTGLCYMRLGDKTTVIELTPGSIDSLAIHSMTRKRKAWCMFVLFDRCLIIASLLAIGSVFLVRTYALRDLILNAVALGFMLDVDELVYSTMAPTNVRHFVSCLEPIPKDRGTFYRRFGFDKNKLYFFIYLPLCLGSTIPLLVDARHIIRQVRDAICGGYLDFVYAWDPGGAVVAHSSYTTEGLYPAPVGPYVPFPLHRSTEAIAGAIRQIIDDPAAESRGPMNSHSDTAPVLYGSYFGLSERPSMSVGQRMSQLNPTCEDITAVDMVWPKEFIVRSLEMHPVLNSGILSGTSSCSASETLHYCHWDNQIGHAMRKWCSKSCGCHEANSSLVLDKDESGCPRICMSRQPYVDSLAEAKCEDNDVSTPAWQKYIFGLSSLRESYKHIPDWYAMFGGWVSSLSEKGCSGHILLDGRGAAFGDLCGETAFGLRTLQWLCPVTCKCGSEKIRLEIVNGQAELCPLSCR